MTGPQPSGALQRSTAADQVAGFVYQLERALDALFDLDEGESLGIEVLDDYHVEDADGPRALAQLKLHQSRSSLSDGATDLWKTLGIWARAVADGSLDLRAMRELRLITTASVPANSLAALVA